MSAEGARVLVTRPEPGLSETMDAVRAAGMIPIACPMLRIAARPLVVPRARPAAIVVTSGQALAALATLRAEGVIDPATPLLAVGDRTAARARDAGFRAVESASGAAPDLVARLDGRLVPHAPVLLATGAGEGHALAQDLRGLGYRVSRRIAYAATPMRALPREVMAQWGVSPFAALFFSPATARAFSSIGPPPELLRQACAVVMSDAVARALDAASWREIRAARHPDTPAMLAALTAISLPRRQV